MKSCVRSQIRRKDSSLALFFFVSSSLDPSRRTFSARGGGGGGVRSHPSHPPPCLRICHCPCRFCYHRAKKYHPNRCPLSTQYLRQNLICPPASHLYHLNLISTSNCEFLLEMYHFPSFWKSLSLTKLTYTPTLYLVVPKHFFIPLISPPGYKPPPPFPFISPPKIPYEVI